MKAFLLWIYYYRSIRAKHFLIDENGVVKLSGLRSMTSLIQGGTRKKVTLDYVMYGYSCHYCICTLV